MFDTIYLKMIPIMTIGQDKIIHALFQQKELISSRISLLSD